MSVVADVSQPLAEAVAPPPLAEVVALPGPKSVALAAERGAIP